MVVAAAAVAAATAKEPRNLHPALELGGRGEPTRAARRPPPAAADRRRPAQSTEPKPTIRTIRSTTCVTYFRKYHCSIQGNPLSYKSKLLRKLQNKTSWEI